MMPPRFSDPALTGALLESIRAAAGRIGRNVTLMEVCGTHTMEIGRLGLRALLPESIRLVSGPGCPVCVTPGQVIDAAIELAGRDNTTVLSFGDMIRVPGTHGSLEHASAKGACVQELVSALQAVDMAGQHPRRQFVFIAVGFETTAPVIARAVTLAAEKGLDNLHMLVSLRLVPPALDALLGDPRHDIQAFLLPGHVSAVIGMQAYARLPEAGVPGVITGFEALDILSGIHTALRLIEDGSAQVINGYRRVVKSEGNPRARALIDEVFAPHDAMWRGIGVIANSGLSLRPAFAGLDAATRYGIRMGTSDMPEGCCCAAVLTGRISPSQCGLFGQRCTPQHPVGPCMVSSEGSCAACYRYEVSHA